MRRLAAWVLVALGCHVFGVADGQQVPEVSGSILDLVARAGNNVTVSTTNRLAADDALSLLALAANGAPDVTVADAVDTHREESTSKFTIVLPILAEDTVTAALLLGATHRPYAHARLVIQAFSEVGGQIQTATRLNRSFDRVSDYDRDTTLQAIALSHATGEPPRAADVASRDELLRASTEFRYAALLPPRQAALALTMGASFRNAPPGPLTSLWPRPGLPDPSAPYAIAP